MMLLNMIPDQKDDGKKRKLGQTIDMSTLAIFTP